MKNKKHWLRYLGFLGFLGLLGLLTDFIGFYGFFGFFGFFAYGRMSKDERFVANVNKAAKNALIAAVLVFVIMGVWAFLAMNAIILAYGFGLSFAVQLFVFGISLGYYEKR